MGLPDLGLGGLGSGWAGLVTLGLVMLGLGQRLELGWGWVGPRGDWDRQGLQGRRPHPCSVVEASQAPSITVRGLLPGFSAPQVPVHPPDRGPAEGSAQTHRRSRAG